MPINQREDGAYLVAKQTIFTRLGKLLNIVPNPLLALADLVVPVIDVTPAKPGLQPLDLFLVNAIGTIPLPAGSVGYYAGSRHVPAVGAAVSIVAMSGIQSGIIFRVGGNVYSDALESEAIQTSTLISLENSGGTRFYNNWAGVCPANSGGIHFESPLLRAPEDMRLILSSAAVALRTYRADYWIEVYETLTA